MKEEVEFQIASKEFGEKAEVDYMNKFLRTYLTMMYSNPNIALEYYTSWEKNPKKKCHVATDAWKQSL